MLQGTGCNQLMAAAAGCLILLPLPSPLSPLPASMTAQRMIKSLRVLRRPFPRVILPHSHPTPADLSSPNRQLLGQDRLLVRLMTIDFPRFPQPGNQVERDVRDVQKKRRKNAVASKRLVLLNMAANALRRSLTGVVGLATAGAAVHHMASGDTLLVVLLAGASLLPPALRVRLHGRPRLR